MCSYHWLICKPSSGKSCVWPKKSKEKLCRHFFSRKQSQLPSMAFYCLNYCVFVFCLKQIINREDPFESNRCLKTLSSDKSNLYTKYFGAVVYSATVSLFYCSCDLKGANPLRLRKSRWLSSTYHWLNFYPAPKKNTTISSVTLLISIQEWTFTKHDTYWYTVLRFVSILHY